MMTGFQMEIVAVMGEGEAFCLGCAGENYDPEDALSRYSADEFLDTARSEYGDEDHQDCACTNGYYCGGCGDEIVEPYVDEISHYSDE